MELDPDYSFEEDDNDSLAELIEEKRHLDTGSEYEEGPEQLGDEGGEGGSLYASSDEGHGYGERSFLKRPEPAAPQAPPPFKRQRGNYSGQYLKLLTEDTDNAVLHRVHYSSNNSGLQRSQIGLTLWTIPEKQLFFNAVALLGRHDVGGIAARVRSKSEVEVSQYLYFLQNATTRRREKPRDPTLDASKIPAAVELSEQCCQALEEVADEISLRHERRDQKLEENIWGDTWDITPALAEEASRTKRTKIQEQPDFAQLFHLPVWLELSQDVFMNSSVESGNWNFVDDKPPSMWATTFEEFHALALAFTKKLVLETLSKSTRRSKKRKNRAAKSHFVLEKDVNAAISSLDLPRNSHEFWRKSARRLRLSVYEEPPKPGQDGEGDPMAYDMVEEVLSGKRKRKSMEEVMDTPDATSSARVLAEDDPIGSGSDSEASGALADEEAEKINEEVQEVLTYSATTLSQRHVTKSYLEGCIKVERQKEQHADRRDQYASYMAERAMWDLVGKSPPFKIPKLKDPGPGPRSIKNLESVYSEARRWDESIDYRSEWENKVPRGDRKT